MPRRPNTACSLCGALSWPTNGVKGCDQICRQCRKEARPERHPTTGWVCASCGVECQRKPARGQRPKLCESCRKRGGRWIPTPARLAIYERDSWVCGICREPVDRDLIGSRSQWRPSLDHIIPSAHGGGDDAANLRLTHFWCNVARSTARHADEVFRAA